MSGAADTVAAESAIAAAVADAAQAGEPLLVCGNGTKQGMLRPVQAARSLSTRDLTGITLYAPKELVLSARAGAPLPEIQATLAEQGQHLIGEPPDLGALLRAPDRPQTIGGIVATNLSGPRRVAWGAMRDHVLGLRVVTGWRRGGPLRRPRPEERHRPRPVQIALRQPWHAGGDHRDHA